VIIEPAALLRHHECQSRQAGVRLEERYLFEQRWAACLERGDLETQRLVKKPKTA
jgi:hypothetical protein